MTPEAAKDRIGWFPVAYKPGADSDQPSVDIPISDTRYCAASNDLIADGWGLVGVGWYRTRRKWFFFGPWRYNIVHTYQRIEANS